MSIHGERIDELHEHRYDPPGKYVNFVRATWRCDRLTRVYDAISEESKHRRQIASETDVPIHHVEFITMMLVDLGFIGRERWEEDGTRFVYYPLTDGDANDVISRLGEIYGVEPAV